jgi:hypothetical protein
MRESVSIRNTTAATRRATVELGNSESSCVDDVVRLLPLWPRDLADRSIEGRKKVIAVLDRALRQERRRGHAGHSAYAIERHAALYRALKKERAALNALQLRGVANRRIDVVRE